MRNTTKAWISIIMGAMFIITDIISYIPMPQYIIELTCISNMSIGILLLITGIRLLKGKKELPSFPYHMFLVTITMVCTVSIIGHFNFKGGFFFLHLINPVAFLVYYLFLVKDKKQFKLNFLTPVFVLCYLGFDYVIGMLRGKFVYGIFQVQEMNIVIMLGAVIVTYIALLLVAMVTNFINQKIQTK